MTDFRKETKGLKGAMAFSERQKKPTFFTGGRAKGHAVRPKDFETEVYLNGEIETANGDRFHAIIIVTPCDSGEHWGTLIYKASDEPCWLCKHMAKRWPNIPKGHGYAFKQGGKFKMWADIDGHKPTPCPCCGGSGMIKTAELIGDDDKNYMEKLGLKKGDFTPYKYRYYNHHEMQARFNFHDHHINEDTGWSN